MERTHGIKTIQDINALEYVLSTAKPHGTNGACIFTSYLKVS